MQLEEYFDFEKLPTYDRIRLKGTRISIEHVLDHYLQGQSAEAILNNFKPSLSLEQVYATITFYLQRRAEIDLYLQRVKNAEEAAYQQHLKQEPPEVVKRLRATVAERTKSRAES